MSSGGDWPNLELEKAVRRAQVAIGLGRLCGQAVGPLRTEATELATRGEVGPWNSFATKLSALYVLAKESNSAVADRTGRVFGTTDAPARTYAKVRKDFWSWAVERYDREAGSRGQGRIPYYLEAIGKSLCKPRSIDKIKLSWSGCLNQLSHQ